MIFIKRKLCADKFDILVEKITQIISIVDSFDFKQIQGVVIPEVTNVEWF